MQFLLQVEEWKLQNMQTLIDLLIKYLVCKLVLCKTFTCGNTSEITDKKLYLLKVQYLRIER